MPEGLLGRYLRNLREDHASGEAAVEVSGYGALQALLNSAGERLSPRVRAVVNPRNRGAGTPDGGLFTSDQFRRDEGTVGRDDWPAQLPSRGAVEVKGLREDVEEVAASEQVGRYLERYGQVLVTNYRDFLLVGRGSDGAATPIERYELAPDERGIWRLAASREMAGEHAGPFGEFLTRVLAHGSPIRRSRDLAWFLASYARESLARLDARPAEAETRALGTVRTALEGALGIGFEGPRGEHFFRSTLVQTLFYGVFSAWVLWSKQAPYDSAERFDWRLAAYTLNVPLIGALFEQLTLRSTMEALGLREVMDRTGELLNRVERGPFFEDFEEEGAVQYFYEPFLEAFDPELRQQLGVWYTPREVVRYMVERVDRTLKDELGIEGGLAAEGVYVLDPCCGTGAYLVEVLSRMDRTLRKSGEDALVAQDLKRAATKRVFGFEILPAPFVVAHLQLGLLLQNLGAPLSDEAGERASVYLTNALTGWEPREEGKRALPLPEFEEEREAAEGIKRETPVLVVLGNPPYYPYSGVGVEEERALVGEYRTTRRGPKPEGQGLNDLYVRFFRIAERQIAEKTSRGVVCYVSNYSWLDGRSYPGMRERYLDAFDGIWIDRLNGDSRKTGKVAPDGRPDPSIFSTETNREGIRVGTAIALLARKDRHEGTSCVSFRDFWGPNKREELLASLDDPDAGPPYEVFEPEAELGHPFAPLETSPGYLTWPLLEELFPVSYPGIQPSRDAVVVDIDREKLVERMEAYFDPEVSDEEMARISPAAMRTTSGFDAPSARRTLQRRGLLRENFVRYCYRPFDSRWLYWEPETKLLDRNRPDYFPQVFEGNVWMSAAQQNRKLYDPPYFTSVHTSRHVIERGANLFPLYVKETDSLFADTDLTESAQPNLTAMAQGYLEGLGNGADAEVLFYHALAISHSLAYAEENAGALRQNWPRVPLPSASGALLASAGLGRRLAALMDTEVAVPGVSGGTLRPELRLMGQVSSTGERPLDPSAGDLVVRAGWGYRAPSGAIMPGQGRAVERDYAPEELTAIERGTAELGVSSDEVLAALGETTFDVYLNDGAYWRNVPARVWEYTSGGYRVVKKWLSYREERVLGRGLEVEEVREIGRIVRRIAAILLMGPDLDANYRITNLDGLSGGGVGLSE
jgi:hypothetical protein